MKKEEILRDVVIAAPCKMSWEAMTGDDKVRHCGGCSKNVYNLSAMTDQEAEEFLSTAQAPCLRFFRREDGTIMTDNCPVGLRKLRDRMRAVVRVAAGFIACVFAMPTSIAQSDRRQPLQGGASLQVRRPLNPGQIIVPPDGPPVQRRPNLQTTQSPVQTPKPVTKEYTWATKPKPNAEKENSKDGIEPNGTDTTALNLYKKGREKENQKNNQLAEFFYEKALEAVEKQGSSADPKFKTLIETRLADVRKPVKPKSLPTK